MEISHDYLEWRSGLKELNCRLSLLTPTFLSSCGQPGFSAERERTVNYVADCSHCPEVNGLRPEW